MTALLMFPALLSLIFLGFPVAFALMGAAFVFGIVELGQSAGYQFASKLVDLSSNYVLAAIPLFVLMGSILERAGMAQDMFRILNRWLRRVPGGIGVSAILLCVIFAMSSGVSGATETIVGLLAVPAMQRARYPNDLIAGSICAGGSLGTIIPPSVLTLILAPTAGLPVLDLFKATLVPGLLLAATYAIYLVVRCWLAHPETWASHAVEHDGETPPTIAEVVKAFFAPVCLIAVVLGSILYGLATATEAAALGVVGAIVIAFVRSALSWELLVRTAGETVRITCMIVLILFGGALFSTVFITSGGLSAVEIFFARLDATPGTILLIVLGISFLLGFVLDQISIILVVISLAMPIVAKAGVEPVWFCVLFSIVLQTSYLTPPMAPAIFFFRAIAPADITLHHMFRGVVPFIFLELIVLMLVYAFPGLIFY